MEAPADARAYDALEQHPRRADLAALARAVLSATAESLRSEPDPAKVAELAVAQGLSRDDAGTPFGNALDVLERGPEGDPERALACALAGQGLAASPPDGDVGRAAADLLWLAARSPFDASGLVDRALGERSAPFWEAVAEQVRRAESRAARGLGRAEALVGAAALVASTSPAAARVAATLASETRDPRLARVLTAAADVAAPEPVSGEVTRAPRGGFGTAVLGLTGLLLVAQGARMLARLALGYRRPARVTLEGGGLRLRWHTELLGRTLGEHDVLVPRAGLSRATRDVRYPGLALYAGLLALAVGSVIGVSTFVDGARAASPSMVVTGLLVVALGLGLDFALTSLVPSAAGRCRVLVVVRDGARLCIGGVETAKADALLGKLAQRS